MKKIAMLVIICLMILVINVNAMPPASLSSHITNPGGMTELETLGGKILGGINAVGYTVALGVLMYIGITIMIAAPSERAQVKSMMIPYVVGAIIAIASLSVVNIIARIAEKISAT